MPKHQMKYDYYLHKSGGKVFDYFGGIGKPYKVSFIWFWFMKLVGYKATRVRKGVNLRRVYIRATLNTRVAHRRSYFMENILKGNYDEV